MRRVIESISLRFESSQPTARGLKDIRMPRIGETVVLAGANGSGKTRTLAIVADIARNVKPFVDGAKIANPQKIILYNVPSLTPQVEAIESATAGILSTVRHQLLRDTANFPANVSLALRMAQVCLTDFLATGNQLLPIDQTERQDRITRWNALQEIGVSILGVALDYDSDGGLLINGEAADHAFGEFSLGQRKLFSFAASLVGRTIADRETIVLFDEPEIHLHPQAALQMLKAMQRVLKDGQLWIATHSVPIIAGLGLENVWYAERGSISYGGNRIERVINSLMGGKENTMPLRQMLSEPDRISLARFAAECLASPPHASTPGPREPQFDQALEAIRSSVPTDRPLSLLDWGAGRGRFKIWLSQQPDDVQDRVRYFAYEPDDETAREHVERVQRSGGDVSNLARTIDEVNQHAGDVGGFEIVLLSNVLHEIEPGQWEEVFSNIRSVIRPDGRLLILEDREMPIGELPNATGFVIVDRCACADLFNSTLGAIEEQTSLDHDRAHRLVCFAISAKLLKGNSKAAVLKSLAGLNERAMSAIESVRASRMADQSKPISQKDGLLHALHLLQYSNTAIALRLLSSQANSGGHVTDLDAAASP